MTGDVDNWMKYIQQLGFKVLHNQHVKITHNNNSSSEYFYLAGTDDIFADSIQ